MKLIITLLFLSLSALSYGQNEAETTCNINNYRDYIYTPGLHQCDLSGADLSNKDFSYSLLSEANLRDANLCGANLSGANMIEADFSNANLSGANLSWSTLRKANMTGANLSGADFTEAMVDPELASYLREHGISGFVIVFRKGDDVFRVNIHKKPDLNFSGRVYLKKK